MYCVFCGSRKIKEEERFITEYMNGRKVVITLNIRCLRCNKKTSVQYIISKRRNGWRIA